MRNPKRKNKALGTYVQFRETGLDVAAVPFPTPRELHHIAELGRTLRGWCFRQSRPLQVFATTLKYETTGQVVISSRGGSYLPSVR